MITSLALFLVAWIVAALALVLVCRFGTIRRVLREPILALPVLVVESDDWGPGPLDDARRLRKIARCLGAIRDQTGHPAVMTLGVVLGVPDGLAILASGCRYYVRRTLAEEEFAPIVEAIKDGCNAGVFALQRHGLEHCWPASLLAWAREEAAGRQWLAQPLARSEALPACLQSRWVDAARLPAGFLPDQGITRAVTEEAALFLRVFGEAPNVAVPNTFIWDEIVERAWAASGIRWVVTPGRRFAGRDGEGKLTLSLRSLRNGQRSPAGVAYVVRDDYFEPLRGHRAENVWQACAAKTALGRPTLLETHRENFIAPSPHGEAAVAELERALRGVLERKPEVRFLSTAELAEAMEIPTSALLEARPSRRGLTVLRRMRREPELQRLLKFSGLDALFWGVEKAWAAVMGDLVAP